MFLFGMKTMSDGLQKSAGERMRKTVNFMTGNRFAGVLTGFLATAIIQSSSAFSVIVVSFVNAGLLTLTQSIGVIFGTNIGTTLTGWIISLLGFKFNIDNLALPAIGIGFLISITKWKYRSVGELVMGFGFLFLGLYFLTEGMGTDTAKKLLDFDAIGAFRNNRFLAIIVGFGVGLVMTILINSSTASITLIMALAYQNIVTYEMAAGMVMGANLGTTTDAPLAALAGNANSKRAALVHVMFNVIGVAWAVPLLIPMLNLVSFILPGDPWAAINPNDAIPLHIAGLHTTFNIINTLIFLPFVNQFARLVSLMIREKEGKPKDDEHYHFGYISSSGVDSPEMNIVRAEIEISNMAGVVSFMYSRFSKALSALRDTGGKNWEESAAAFIEELEKKEQYVDEMREALTGFLIECTNKASRGTVSSGPFRNRTVGSMVANFRDKLNNRSEIRVARLLRIVGYLEEMSDECYSISRLLEKSVRKDYVFKEKEMNELIPYVGQVEEFLVLLEDQLGGNAANEQKDRVGELENILAKTRKRLNKLGRKRIKAGGNIRSELLFMELVRRIEKLGDYCFDISEAVNSVSAVQKDVGLRLKAGLLRPKKI